MDGYSCNIATGRVQSAEPDAIFMPRTPRTGRRGVVLLHGFASAPSLFRGAQLFSDPTNLISATKIAATLAGNGIPCIAAQFSDNLWGNDTHMAQITAAWNVLIAQCGVASDKICLYGISMGGAAAARYAMLNPTKVAAGYGTCPASDLTDMYVNNRATAQTSIGAAWGVTYPSALPSGANLPGQASAAAAVPWRLDYGTADTVIQPSTVTTLATAWGANCTKTVIDASLDHSDALFAKTDPAAVLAHFTANGA